MYSVIITWSFLLLHATISKSHDISLNLKVKAIL
jgi:hypothetical protein